jgi:DNA-binding protein HU-beta
VAGKLSGSNKQVPNNGVQRQAVKKAAAAKKTATAADRQAVAQLLTRLATPVAARTTPAASKTAAKKATPSKPSRKTVEVDKPTPGTTTTPRHRKTGAKYPAPKLVQRKKPTREQQAALDNHRIRGQA